MDEDGGGPAVFCFKQRLGCVILQICLVHIERAVSTKVVLVKNPCQIWAMCYIIRPEKVGIVESKFPMRHELLLHHIFGETQDGYYQTLRGL
jgi:hypothetical protein